MIRFSLPQTSWYYAPVGADNFGRPATAAPIPLPCRWEDYFSEAIDATGNKVICSAGVYLAVAIKVGGFLQLEGLTDVIDGTAQGGGANSITLAIAASSIDTVYKGMVVVITDGTGAGQSNIVTSYTGASRIATMVNNWTVAPYNTSNYSIYQTDSDNASIKHEIVANGRVPSLKADQYLTKVMLK